MSQLLTKQSKPINLQKILREIEEKYIKDALKVADGNKSKAAELLSMNRTTFQEKCKKMGIAK